MKRMQKVVGVFHDRSLAENRSSLDYMEFKFANDTNLAFFGVFYLCAELGRTPTYLGGARFAAKGFHVHNIEAS